MGIDNLNAFIKDTNIQAFQEVQLSEFREKRVAVDASYIFCTWLAQGAKQIVTHVNFHNPVLPIDKLTASILRSAQQFLEDLLQARIFPIFIHDGEAPEAKQRTLDKRRSEKAHQNAVYLELLQEYQRADVLGRASRLDKLRKAYLRSSFLSKEEYSLLFKKAFSLGVPHASVLNGIDGERLAATLVREGYAAAIWTTDTDSLVHGAHTMITGFISNTRVKVTYLQPILQYFGGNSIYFREFCILLGCDYNEHIYRVGHKTALQLFMEYQGNIEAIARDNNGACLNIEVCRDLFTHVSSAVLVDSNDCQLTFEVEKLPPILRSLVQPSSS
jgi:flap endonuclease-1